jgi:hypothetical protein
MSLELLIGERVCGCRGAELPGLARHSERSGPRMHGAVGGLLKFTIRALIYHAELPRR